MEEITYENFAQLINEAKVFQEAGQYAEAEQTLLQAGDSWQQTDDLTKIQYLTTLAKTQFQLRKFEAAEQTLLPVGNSWQQTDAITKIQYLTALGETKLKLNKLEEANQAVLLGQPFYQQVPIKYQVKYLDISNSIFIKQVSKIINFGVGEFLQ